jgi:hypothetical protein
LFAIFVGRPYCLWCPKNRWSPSFGAFVALKIGKNGLEARKLRPPKIGGSFLHKILNQIAHNLVLKPQKILKYYSIAFKVTLHFKVI